MSSPTRAQFEVALIVDRGLGRWNADVGRDGTTRDGTNPDLADPIRRAVRASGFPVASLFSLADSDLTAVGAEDIEEILDRAHLYALIAVRDAWYQGDNQPSPTLPNATPNTPTARDLNYRRLLGMIDHMQMRLDVEHGDSGARVSTGTINLGFMADCEPEA